MKIADILRNIFREERAPGSLFILSLFFHFVFFGLMIFHYGPLSFYLSTGGNLDGNDGQHYLIIAKNIAEGNGYSRFVDPPYEPDAFRTPLLSLYLLPFFLAGGLPLLWVSIAILNVMLSYGAVVLYKLSRLFLPHTLALFNGIILAVDPLYLYRSQLAEPDALFTLLIISAVYLCVLFWRTAKPKYFYGCTAVLGLGILLKPTALYIAAILFCFQVLFIFSFRRVQWKEISRITAVGFVILFAIVSPWLIRNHRIFYVWEVSSITGFNLYEFYTVEQKMPDEKIPESILTSSREPSRYLPNQQFYTHIALERIYNSPLAYAKDQVIGSVRNVFVSELPVIYYYKNTAILPFPYDPEKGTMGQFTHRVIKILWFVVIGCVYLFALLGLMASWRKDKATFLAFALFFIIFIYLVVASGPYVDAKYRMPGTYFIYIAALFGGKWLWERRESILRFGLK